MTDNLNACRISDPAPVGNYLMKLASVAGCNHIDAEGRAKRGGRRAAGSLLDGCDHNESPKGSA